MKFAWIFVDFRWSRKTNCYEVRTLQQWIIAKFFVSCFRIHVNSCGLLVNSEDEVLWSPYFVTMNYCEILCKSCRNSCEFFWTSSEVVRWTIAKFVRCNNELLQNSIKVVMEFAWILVDLWWSRVMNCYGVRTTWWIIIKFCVTCFEIRLNFVDFWWSWKMNCYGVRTL